MVSSVLYIDLVRCPSGSHYQAVLLFQTFGRFDIERKVYGFEYTHDGYSISDPVWSRLFLYDSLSQKILCGMDLLSYWKFFSLILDGYQLVEDRR